jgi:hypothetical protein
MSKHEKKQARGEFRGAVDRLFGLVVQTVGNDGLKNDAGWRKQAGSELTKIFDAEGRMSRSDRADSVGLMAEIETCAREYGFPVPSPGGR